jgi:RimJ/RimL family protein N-acetyltransferase
MTSAPRQPAAVSLRVATIEDAARFMAWRNDPAAVHFSVSGAPVERVEHERWYAARVKDPSARLWIAEEGGKAVGQVRVDSENGVGVVSIAVEPDQRGRGLGSAILRAMLVEVSRERITETLRATVRHDNVASLRAFERVGFRPLAEPAGGFVVLERSALT